jgi:hypothetical protein
VAVADARRDDRKREMDADQKLKTQPLTLLSKYSLYPPDLAQGYNMDDVDSARYGGRFAQPAANATSPPIELQHHLIGRGERVTYVHLTKVSASDPNMLRTRGAETLKVDINADDPGGWVPAYFLPWNPGGGAVELTIPDKDPATHTEDQHPKLFFTAVLSGCSIFFKGTSRRPTIYHCGRDTASLDYRGAQLDPLEANRLWKRLVEKVAAEGRGRATQPIAVNVTKKDYMFDQARPTGKTTTTALNFKSDLEAMGEVYIEDVAPWGAIFGLRTGRDWTFYLQENATITYYPFKTKFGLLKIKTDKPDKSAPQNMHVVTRPMVVREVFPNYGGRVQLARTLRTLKT